MLNLLEITSYFHSIDVFVITQKKVDTEFVGIRMIYFYTKFHMLGFTDSLLSPSYRKLNIDFTRPLCFVHPPAKTLQKFQIS
jgi:hypothetical protein